MIEQCLPKLLPILRFIERKYPMLNRAGEFRVLAELRQRGRGAVLRDSLTGQRKKHSEIGKTEVQLRRNITGPHTGDDRPFKGRLERQGHSWQAEKYQGRRQMMGLMG